MAIVNNILGQKDRIKHVNGNKLDKTFLVTLNTGADFPLTDYDGEFVILTGQGGTELFPATTGTAALVFDSNTFRVNDLVDLGAIGTLYFELVITKTDDAEIVYRLWSGEFINTL